MAFNQEINSIVSRIDKCFVNIIDFANYLDAKDIPFMNISTLDYGSILCRKNEKELSENEIYECNWYMLRNLENTGIDVIDLAQELADAELSSFDVSDTGFKAIAHSNFPYGSKKSL